MALYLLYESASGFALLEQLEGEEIAIEADDVQKSVQDMKKFSQIVKLRAFIPFSSAENALECCNDISEGVLSETLKTFLEQNLPKAKPGKKSKFKLGVTDNKIGNAISEEMEIKCVANELTAELLRGVRQHFGHFVSDLKEGDVERAQLGLAHSYSRSKVKFNVNRVDNMIIQSISLLDQIDKDLNTMSMRVREWYSWHFPELVKIVSENNAFAKLIVCIQNRDSLKTEDKSEQITEICGDEDLAAAIVAASKASMGYDINEIDMHNIVTFAERVTALFAYRKDLQSYLHERMNTVAPNLATLVGEAVGARLISHAGSLTNLAKYPASTLQILGAEKALFRALKTKGNTPKYGLIFHSSFIGRAATKNKGRISRYLANKCSIASRIDCFSEVSTNVFGLKLRDQVEERLAFYDTGKAPRKNLTVMQEAMAEAGTGPSEGAKSKKDKKEKKQKREEAEEEEEKPKKKKKAKVVEEEEEEEEEKPKKKKKSKA
jgi:nucleolar protein 56